MTYTSDSPVIIIGAGISGLALAQSLLRRQIPFRIYERDAVFNQRAQGYRVRLNADGINALKSCLTPDLYDRLEKSCAHVSGKGTGPLAQLDALTGEPMQQKLSAPPASKGPLILHEFEQTLNADRTVLRDVLMQGLQPYVEFGKEFESHEILPTGVKVHFRDGSVAEGRLLVGADGSSSRVRKQLAPGYRQLDTEGRFIYAKTVLTKELEEKLQEKCLQGLMFARDNSGATPFTMVLEPVRFKNNELRHNLPEDYIYWVILARKDSHGISDKTLLNLSNEEAAGQARAMTTHWHPSFRALFDLQDPARTSIIRIVSGPTEIPSWDSAGKVTLVGDAVHVMSPTAGVGATTALRDSALLAEVIGEGGELEEGVKRYEEAMRAWAQDAIVRSQVVGNMLFGMRPFDELGYVDA